MRRFSTSLSLLTIAACGASASCSHAPPASPSPQPSSAASPSTTTASNAPSVQRDVFVSATDSFSPQRGEAAMRAFVPEVAADETGGECMVGRTPGSGATMVTAFYPARTTSTFQITLTFDSVGHVVRYSERRGIPHIKPPTGATRAQLDSTIRATDASLRSTTISLDYPIDQGMVMNRGGGKPTNAVMATVRDVEHAEKLGSISARLERMRKLCGV
jgi:hypothetical protein